MTLVSSDSIAVLSVLQQHRQPGLESKGTHGSPQAGVGPGVCVGVVLLQPGPHRRQPALLDQRVVQAVSVTRCDIVKGEREAAATDRFLQRVHASQVSPCFFMSSL